MARELDLVRVKGKKQPVRIFEILAPASERERWTPLVERFDAGVAAYRDAAMGRGADGVCGGLADTPGRRPVAAVRGALPRHARSATAGRIGMG